jgi:hypothetical protein
VKQPERLNYVAYESILEPCDQEEEVEWSEQELLAYKASTDPDAIPDPVSSEESALIQNVSNVIVGNPQLLKIMIINIT